MAYALEVARKLDEKLKKMRKREKKKLGIIDKKVREILENPLHYKPLRGDLHGARRVHIDKAFVLIYEVDESKKVVRLLDYGHHDEIY